MARVALLHFSLLQFLPYGTIIIIFQVLISAYKGVRKNFLDEVRLELPLTKSPLLEVRRSSGRH